jgi:uncharacterized protein
MSYTMARASVPAFEIALNALSVVLEKGEAFAAAKKIEPSVLLGSRLAPDMFPLVRQVQIATDTAKRGAARLAGVEPPVYDDNETSFAELKDRIAKTIAFLKSIDSGKIDASVAREITIPLGANNKGQMQGGDYLEYFVLPNMYFHVTAAYAILRHNGVDLGKRDFLGGIPMKMV